MAKAGFLKNGSNTTAEEKDILNIVSFKLLFELCCTVFQAYFTHFELSLR